MFRFVLGVVLIHPLSLLLGLNVLILFKGNEFPFNVNQHHLSSFHTNNKKEQLDENITSAIS